jgi:hypothetical protein
MLSFQKFQSTIKENIPYYLWEFEQKQSSNNNDEYWAKIKNSRIGVRYFCRLNKFIVILQNNNKDYGNQTTIATDIKFIHDAVVSYVQSGF